VLPDFRPADAITVPGSARYQPGGIALTSNVGESPEYIGNRDYRAGDPLRRIDFRSWGRLAKPVVREYQEEYFSRIGVVLDTRGGALRQMLTPFRLGVGGKLGDGKQWMSWIHLADLAAMFQFAVENPVRGVLNGVAPFPVTNADFTQALAMAVRRPAIFPVPVFALKLLFGEMSEILLASQRVLPAAAEAAGFKWGFPELGGALENLLGG